MEIVLVVIAAVTLLIALMTLYLILKKNNSPDVTQEITDSVRREIAAGQSELRQELGAQTQSAVKNMGDLLSENQRDFSRSQYERMRSLEDRMDAFTKQNDEKMNLLRESLDKRLDAMQQDNNRQLDEMRKTVDERLEKSLEDKMNKSFSLVSQRLEQVYKGLGEMQNLAAGVGDLKKVLSNVKTRGILGEIQLGSILSEILSPEQYAENVATKKGSKNVVEFAVKLPAKDDGFIWLPIDSKFPGDTYAALREAIENGDKAQIDACAKTLIATIKNEARDISSKYIDPPNTTEFAIMFLPFEGLYSEVVNRGMVEVLQRDYKVNIAGPSTMAALLNSIQMGFRTLAVQKRSAEVWQVLGSVKKEFDSFAKVLENTQKRLDQANKELDTLVGVRTRQIQRRLKDVETPVEFLEE
ncbi:MAG: DNA recombination protein RmuC [Ruminococcus sp.]|nr:DNA recombination protein RmuC [Ruminococcus sp.]